MKLKQNLISRIKKIERQLRLHLSKERHVEVMPYNATPRQIKNKSKQLQRKYGNNYLMVVIESARVSDARN